MSICSHHTPSCGYYIILYVFSGRIDRSGVIRAEWERSNNYKAEW